MQTFSSIFRSAIHISRYRTSPSLHSHLRLENHQCDNPWMHSKCCPIRTTVTKFHGNKSPLRQMKAPRVHAMLCPFFRLAVHVNTAKTSPSLHSHLRHENPQYNDLWMHSKCCPIRTTVTKFHGNKSPLRQMKATRVHAMLCPLAVREGTHK
jgi:hypothetical protein